MLLLFFEYIISLIKTIIILNFINFLVFLIGIFIKSSHEMNQNIQKLTE